jgi:kojibiose phosphorylase
VFWDTEVFVLPFHIWTHPETARALLAYRHRTLPAARAKAAAFGYEGALYAWESADTGEETTPRCVLMSDGTPIDVLTGVQEHHISGDVAWATWRYWQVTGDDAFLVEMGAEMILEAARFWASRAQAGTDGRYHIREVIGPDEYHEGVDDNAFTNVLAGWNLRTAAQVWEVLAELDGPARGALGARLRLDEAEVARWAGVGAGLVDGFDPETLLYEQFTGFFGYEDVRAADHGTRPFPGDTVLGVERVRHSQMVKQADVVMLAHVLPELVPVEVAAANYGYYEPRTSHGSSLSPAVHAAVAARIGRFDDADAYFRMAAGMDLDRRVGDASKGLHVATMGGLWQAAVLGFGGVAPDGPALRLDPRLPPSWDGLRFSLRWRGTPVHVALTADEVRIDLGGPTVLAVGRGAPSTYGAGQLTARRQGDGWAVPEPVTAR